MSIRHIEYLSIWEVGHRWEAVDPDAALASGLPAKVRDLLRQLAHAVTTALNPYDAHAEIIPMEKLWFSHHIRPIS